MSLLKRLERAAKFGLALIAVPLLWRPRRRRLATALRNARRILLVRIDDRLGEALLMTPLFSVLKRAMPDCELDALVHAKTSRAISGHPKVDRVIAFDARRLFLGAMAPGIRGLRRAAYDAVIDCTNWTDPSVRSALVCRLIGSRSVVIGPDARPVAGLYSIAVAPREGAQSELEQRVHLLSPLARSPGSVRLSFRRPNPAPTLKPLLDRLRSTPFAVVNPGGRLDWRRIPPSAFAAAAHALMESGFSVLITWGPGEASLAKSVAQLAPQSALAPSTDIDDLAALMNGAALTICNNSGPMHLSVALGTPTLAFFLKMDPRRWGYAYPPHRMIDLTATVDRGELDSTVRFEVSKFVEDLRRWRAGGGERSQAKDSGP